VYAGNPNSTITVYGAYIPTDPITVTYPGGVVASCGRADVDAYYITCILPPLSLAGSGLKFTVADHPFTFGDFLVKTVNSSVISYAPAVSYIGRPTDILVHGIGLPGTPATCTLGTGISVNASVSTTTQVKCGFPSTVLRTTTTITVLWVSSTFTATLAPAFTVLLPGVQSRQPSTVLVNTNTTLSFSGGPFDSFLTYRVTAVCQTISLSVEQNAVVLNSAMLAVDLSLQCTGMVNVTLSVLGVTLSPSHLSVVAPVPPTAVNFTFASATPDLIPMLGIPSLIQGGTNGKLCSVAFCGPTKNNAAGFVQGLTVLIGGQVVENVTVLSNTSIQITTPSLNVTGYQSLNLSFGGLSFVFADAFFYTSDCPIQGERSQLAVFVALHPGNGLGMYGVGLDCVPCPVGGYCPGGNRVWPQPGWYAVIVADLLERQE
jgi:hypothetical protein